MENSQILGYIDHTLLKATATWVEIQALCEEALTYKTATVCVPPAYVAPIRQEYGNHLSICTVIGFPLGYNTKEAKVFETVQALRDGADELDLVINLGWVKNGDLAAVASEIAAVRQVSLGKILKVIVETCYLTQEEKIQLCGCVTAAGADYIKTSTGFGTDGANLADLALFRQHIGSKVKIKAAGGIKTREDLVRLIEAGAQRLGTSGAVKLLQNQGDLFHHQESSLAQATNSQEIDYEGLIGQAFAARLKAYAPYSGYWVGAALLTRTGCVYQGCNIESAAYSPTNCAERTAIFKAVSQGDLNFRAIAVVGGHKDCPLEQLDYFAPCGVCRQVMQEFCQPEFPVILAKSPQLYKIYPLKTLLPLAFDPATVSQARVEKKQS